jgi:hypothetical protein
MQPCKPIKRAFTGLVGLPPEDPAPTPVSTPEPVVSVTPPADPTCQYHRARDQWICVYCSHKASEDDMTASGIPASRICSAQNILRQNRETVGKELGKKFAERERRAGAERERRKKKADQLAAIKEALRTPPEIRIAAAKEKERQEKAEVQANKLPSDRTGGFKEISGGGILEETLTILDAPQTGRVTPEGVGHRPGARDNSTDDIPDSTENHNPWSGLSEVIAVERPNAPIIPGSIFLVKLNDKDERDTPAYQSVPHFFTEMMPLRYRLRCMNCAAVQDDDFTVSEEHFVCGRCGTKNGGDDLNYICRLCGVVAEDRTTAAHHMETAHGDETAPGHDTRFGDVLQRWVKGGKKPPNIQRTVKRAQKQVTAQVVENKG